MNFKHIVIGSLLCLPWMSSAQDLRCPPIDATGNGTQKIDITLGAGPTLLYGDINHRSNVGYGLVLKGDYKIYKGFYAGLEIQGGQLRATGQRNYPEQQDWDPRYVRNRYWAGSVNATVYPYRFFVNERDLFKKSKLEQFVLNGLYVGVGLGGVLNNYSEIERELTYGQGLVNGEYETEPDGTPRLDIEGEILYLDKTKSALLPIVNVGLAVPLNKYYSHGPGYFSVVINSQFNFANNENLDGYDPRGGTGERPAGASNDMYNFTYVGIRYSF